MEQYGKICFQERWLVKEMRQASWSQRYHFSPVIGIVSAQGQETVSLIAYPSNAVSELPCTRSAARDGVHEVDTGGLILPVRKYYKQGEQGFVHLVFLERGFCSDTVLEPLL